MNISFRINGMAVSNRPVRFCRDPWLMIVRGYVWGDGPVTIATILRCAVGKDSINWTLEDGERIDAILRYLGYRLGPDGETYSPKKGNL